MTSQPASPPLLHGRRLAVIAAAGFGAVVLFQLAIVLGAPLGTAAWGRAHSGQRPFELRLASAFSAGFWTLAALTVLSRGGIGLSPVPYASGRWGTWVLFGVLALGAAVNLASASNWERFGWAPLTTALALSCFMLARTDDSSA